MTQWILNYWMQTLVILSTGGMVSLAAWVGRQVVGVNKGVLALLHSELYRECERHLRDGWIRTVELNDLEHLYGAYAVLGGNGTLKVLYDRCLKLPHKLEGMEEA